MGATQSIRYNQELFIKKFKFEPTHVSYFYDPPNHPGPTLDKSGYVMHLCYDSPNYIQMYNTILPMGAAGFVVEWNGVINKIVDVSPVKLHDLTAKVAGIVSYQVSLPTPHIDRDYLEVIFDKNPFYFHERYARFIVSGEEAGKLKVGNTYKFMVKMTDGTNIYELMSWDDGL